MKIWKIILLASLAIPLLLALYIIFLFDWNLIKGFAESKSSSSTGRSIKIAGDLDVDFHWNFSPTISMSNVTVTNMATGSEPEMVKAEKIQFDFSIFSAFSDQLNFPVIQMKNANLLLEKDKEGRANWLFGEQDDQDKSKPPRIGQLFVENSKITFKDPVQGTNLNVVANSSGDFRKTDEANLLKNFISLKGDGSYKNNPFNIDFTGASVLDLQKREQPYPLKTSIIIGHTTINVEGTALDPTELEGLDITLNVKGANAADIFPIFGIVLPPTPPYSLTGKLDYENKIWKFNNFNGKMGESDLSGNLSWDTNKPRPLFTAKFVSKNLNFKDLGGFIGAPPATKEVEKLNPEQKAKVAEAQVSPYVIPDAPLDISRLSAMDADVEFTGKHVVSADLPLDDFFMHVMLNNNLLEVKPVKFGTANGDIVANLEVNARKEPVVIASEFQFRKLALSRLFEDMPVGNKKFNQGYIGGTAKLKGTGKSLREMLANANGTIGIGMEGGQLSNLLIELIGLDVAESLGFMLSGDKPVPIRCVIGDFEVKDGTMKSKTIIADTNDTNVKGEGTINLASEKMDIKLIARPKDQSLLSLKSPVLITGTLKNPSVGIDSKRLIARGSLAAAASVVLTPFVGALAFVEEGLGKDSNCAKLLAEMNTDNKKSTASSLVPKNANAPVGSTNENGVNSVKDDKKVDKNDDDDKKITTPQTHSNSQSTAKKTEAPALPGTGIPGQ